MTTKNFLRIEPGERIDHPDLQFAVEQSIRDGLLQAGLLWVEDQGLRIVSGFEASAVGTEITATRGTAIAGMRDRGEVKLGAVISGGPESKTIDVGSLGDGDYNLYIRYEQGDDEFQNRAFWDDLATPAEETTRTIPTRFSENWSLAVELATTAVSSEWALLGGFTMLSGNISGGITDKRDLLFDNRADSQTAITASDVGSGFPGAWGTAKSFGRWAKQIMGQIEGIIGTQPEVVTGTSWRQSVSKSLGSMLPVDGSRSMTGNLLSAATETIGEIANRWTAGYFSTFDATTVDATTLNADTGNIKVVVAERFVPTTSSPQVPPEPRLHIDNLVVAHGSFDLDATGGPSVLVTVRNVFNVSLTTTPPAYTSGEFVVTFNSALASTNYTVVAQSERLDANPQNVYNIIVKSKTALAITFELQRIGVEDIEDIDTTNLSVRLHFMAMGAGYA